MGLWRLMNSTTSSCPRRKSRRLPQTARIPWVSRPRRQHVDKVGILFTTATRGGRGLVMVPPLASESPWARNQPGPGRVRPNSQRRRGALRYVTQVMAARGYPLEDRRADDLSVDHPVVVQNYRTARALALRRQRREAGTEEMRQAVVNYRALLTNFSCQCVTVIWVCERTNYHVQTETLPNSRSICLNGYTCLGERNGRRDHTHPAAVSADCPR